MPQDAERESGRANCSPAKIAGTSEGIMDKASLPELG